jgi:hypothetical protein
VAFTTYPHLNAEVKERVELYFYSPSGPSWPVIGQTFTVTFKGLPRLKACPGQHKKNLIHRSKNKKILKNTAKQDLAACDT